MTEQATRRDALAALLATATLGATPARADDAPPWKARDAALAATSAATPLVLPRTEFVYEALFDLAPTLQLGMSPLGDRRMVPITGGRFEGPQIAGRVLPGGADRQLVRRDGAVALDATYELETDDGVVVSVRNRVLSRQPPSTPRYAVSTLDITAPEGKYGWLNDWVYVGTLHGLRPRPNVLIRVYKVV
ncbi:MAG: DUF3237 domain-containing protein [Rhizobacter sp.]|nr:DUF3237 domain-containing protein [Rhizobacter sp.]